MRAATLECMPAEREHSSLIVEEPVEHRFSPILGENVSRLRRAAKINKKRFALMVGIGRPFLNKIENGTANPRLAVVVKIADALETTPGYLLTRHDKDAAGGSPNRKTGARATERHHARLY